MATPSFLSRFKSGDSIFNENDAGKEMFIIEQGKVQLDDRVRQCCVACVARAVADLREHRGARGSGWIVIAEDDRER